MCWWEDFQSFKQHKNMNNSTKLEIQPHSMKYSAKHICQTKSKYCKFVLTFSNSGQVCEKIFLKPSLMEHGLLTSQHMTRNLMDLIENCAKLDAYKEENRNSSNHHEVMRIKLKKFLMDINTVAKGWNDYCSDQNCQAPTWSAKLLQLWNYICSFLSIISQLWMKIYQH